RAPRETVLCIEIPEGRWGPDRDFLTELPALLAQLRDAGIVRGAADVRPTAAHQLYLPRVYPLYRRGWLAGWREAMREAAQDGLLFPIGRQGLFLHCNIDHCVRIAADISEHISNGRSALEWVEHSERYLDLRVRD